MRKSVKWGLMRLYIGICESMWRYEYPDERFDDMQAMSWDTAPEYFMFNNGQAVWFEDPASKQIHILPFNTTSDGVNMYGKPVAWNPIPVGYTDMDKGKNPAIDRIRNLRLSYDDSVIMRNDLCGGGDRDYIDSMVSEMVDNTLTFNQLQLLAKCPFIFNVTEDNLLSAKNFYLMLASDKPVIFTNAMGDKTIPSVETTNVQIDTALFDLFDRWESQLLTYLGIPCVPITKRAQQTVSEVQSNDSKLYLRRMEKLNQRKKAMERMKKVFGVSPEVYSVIDEDIQRMAEKDAEGTEVSYDE